MLNHRNDTFSYKESQKMNVTYLADETLANLMVWSVLFGIIGL